MLLLTQVNIWKHPSKTKNLKINHKAGILTLQNYMLETEERIQRKCKNRKIISLNLS